MEIKELGVAVQIRRTDPSTAPVIMAQAEELRRTSAGESRVWQSESTVGLFPDVDWRKGSSALWVLEQWMLEGRGQPSVVYLGDDDADEDPYLALREYGYAVHVGRVAGESAAPYWVVDQAAAIDLLARIAFAWSVHTTDEDSCLLIVGRREDEEQADSVRRGRRAEEESEVREVLGT